MGVFDFFKKGWKKAYDVESVATRNTIKGNLNRIISEYSSASKDLSDKQSAFKSAQDKLNELVKEINNEGGEKLITEKLEYLTKLETVKPKTGGATAKRKSSSNKRKTIKK